jgi:hypothetical protein
VEFCGRKHKDRTFLGAVSRFELNSRLPTGFAPLAAETATAAVAATAAATTAKAVSALFTSTRFVHVQRAPIQVAAVKAVYCISGFSGIRHFHEGEATGLTGVPVANDTHALHGPILRKGGLKLALSRLIREVSNKDVRHDTLQKLK